LPCLIAGLLLAQHAGAPSALSTTRPRATCRRSIARRQRHRPPS